MEILGMELKVYSGWVGSKELPLPGNRRCIDPRFTAWVAPCCHQGPSDRQVS